jgi:hypothetical protein
VGHGPVCTLGAHTSHGIPMNSEISSPSRAAASRSASRKRPCSRVEIFASA